MLHSFFSGLSPSNLSLLKILNGLSSSINIAKKILPIYNDIKPLAKSIPNIINKIKNINISNISSNTLTNQIKSSENTNKSGPVFFQ